jgi:hypothetical protein
MAVFVVIPQPNARIGGLAPAITSQFADAYFPLEDEKGWLISATSTPQDLSSKLGITDGTNGAALIFEIGAYFGRANPNIWNWLKLKLERPPSGQPL